MKLFILCVLLFLIIIGCHHFKPARNSKPIKKHRAVYAALIYGNRYQTRVVIGKAKTGGNLYHAQAQALINDIWEWLEVDCGRVVISEQDWWFYPRRIFTVRQAIDVCKKLKFIGE